jgi:hypothetical protein
MALARGVAEKSAGARVHRGGEHEARRESHRRRGARDGDRAVLMRLSL